MFAITVYSTGPSCMRCRMTERELTKAGLNYEVVNITEPGREELRTWLTEDLGYTEAPVVMIGDDNHWSGFRPDLIKRAAAALAAEAVAGPAPPTRTPVSASQAPPVCIAPSGAPAAATRRQGPAVEPHARAL